MQRPAHSTPTIDATEKRIRRLRVPRTRQNQLKSIMDEGWEKLEAICVPFEIDNAIQQHLLEIGYQVSLDQIRQELNRPLIDILTKLREKSDTPLVQPTGPEREQDVSTAG